jgi:hypothetical protein
VINSKQLIDFLEPWKAPTLLNGWGLYSPLGTWNPPGYYKDITGRVYLRGLLSKAAGATTAIMFQLPASYRPPFQCIFPAIALDVLCEIRVDNLGNVWASAGGSNNWTCIDSVNFLTT